MADKNTAETVREALGDKIEALGYRLWDVEFVKEASEWYLRFTIDSDEGIDIEDCEKVHRFIDPLLDELDPIEQSYHLEVSSPGIEREIRTPEHFAACIGEKVEVRLFAPLDGRKSYTGILVSYENDEIKLDDSGREYVIPRGKASKIKTVFDF
ncbi:MAG: ribosome maturation factor RimP [Clostridia bacterium]|nr:ribosome maturation factor RimP [Clostridia bacterium]